MENNYIVYQHYNPSNGKSYIGITKYGNKPNTRWRNGYGYIENDKFFKDIIKYGWNNFEHNILETNLDIAEAEKKERYYIKLFNSELEGYNRNPGGTTPGLESSKKISKALTGITRDKKSIEKQLKTKKDRYGSGRGIHYLGKSKKVKCLNTGEIFASVKEAERWCNSTKVGECCNKNRQHAGKHPITNELLEWVFANEDEEVTTSCEEPLKEKKKINKIYCVETQTVYNNASEAYEMTGIHFSNILKVCKGERKTAGKYHWKFIEEE